LLVAELVDDEDAAEPLRSTLGLERDDVQQLVQPLALELEDRDERIAELEEADTTLRLELQAKRQRVVALERGAERAQDEAESTETEISELRNELQRWRMRCAAVEASLHEAEGKVVQLREQALPQRAQEHEHEHEEQDGEQQQQQQHIAAQEIAALKAADERALAAELANGELVRQLELLHTTESEAVHAERARCAVATTLLVDDLRSCEGVLLAAMQPRSPPATPDAEMRAVRKQLEIELQLEQERADFAAQLERRTAEAAAAARAQAEEEWRGHLERAVVLTREAALSARTTSGHVTPAKYASGAAGQLALLDDLSHLQSACAAAVAKRRTPQRPGSSPALQQGKHRGRSTPRVRGHRVEPVDAHPFEDGC
jgi:hypothetical protein